MIYMLKVDMLVATIAFGFVSLLILVLFASTEAKEYANALRAMQRIAEPASRGPSAISRVNSRNLDPDSFPCCLNSIS